MGSKEKKINGFTILELLVSMFIMIVLSTILVARYRSSNPDYTLTQAAQKMASDIRKAQNMSMNGIDINSTTGYYGYGINVSKNTSSYILFADKGNDKKYDNGTDVKIGGADIQLPAKIIIDSIRFGNPVNTADIFFVPPDPTTSIITFPSRLSTEIDITLKEQSTSKTKTVEVNLAGLIEAQ